MPYKPKKATLGIVRSMKALAADKDEAPTHVAIAFDNPIRSFRNDLYADYKSDEGVLPELREQFDEAEVAVRALGLVVWSMKEWETDDALATACVKYARDFDQIRILSPDKDFGQCLRGDAVVQIDRVRRKLIDEKSLRALRGFGPASIPDWLALVGDIGRRISGRRRLRRQERRRAARQVRARRIIPDDWHAVAARPSAAATGSRPSSRPTDRTLHYTSVSPRS